LLLAVVVAAPAGGFAGAAVVALGLALIRRKGSWWFQGCSAGLVPLVRYGVADRHGCPTRIT